MLPSFFDLYQLGNKEHSFTPTNEQITAVKLSYYYLKNALEMGQKFYGIHTGFGANVTTKANDIEYKKHQLDLLNYLKVGTGDFFQEKIIRRALNLQLYKVGRGFSGVHPVTFTRLAKLVCSDTLPKVPEYGSLGASGDLIPMAHAIAPIFDENNEFGPRDILALVNTNSIMASYAVELLFEVKTILKNTYRITALNSLALCSIDDSFSEKGLSINQDLFPNVMLAGQNILEQRKILNEIFTKKSEKSSTKKNALFDIPLQERYSIRCSPQILGNIISQIEFVENRIIAESLSICDNPLVLPDKDITSNSKQPIGSPWHGGLFYTASLASSVDMLMDVLGRITELVDRQILLLMHPDTSHGLPENLGTAKDLHLKGLHQLISALQQQIRSLAIPSRLMSFSSESNNQDVLPCSMAALHNLKKSVDISNQIMKASFFVAQRGCYYRFNLNIPLNLKLDAWHNYNNSQYKFDI